MNAAAAAILPRFVADLSALAPPVNIMRLLFQPTGARPFIVNWEEVAATLIQRLHREAAMAPNDEATRALLDQSLAADGVPEDWRTLDHGADHPVIVPIHLRRDDLELRLFTAMTTLGTPLDITLSDTVGPGSETPK